MPDQAGRVAETVEAASAVCGSERDAAELREINELRREIAEQDALLDEHHASLVSERAIERECVCPPNKGEKESARDFFLGLLWPRERRK